MLSNNGQHIQLSLDNPTQKNAVRDSNHLTVIFIICSRRKLSETLRPRMGPGRESDVVGLSDFPIQQQYWAEISRKKDFVSPP